MPFWHKAHVSRCALARHAHAAQMAARALYDFQGNGELGEMSFSAGDVITIIRQACNLKFIFSRMLSRCRMLARAGGRAS